MVLNPKNVDKWTHKNKKPPYEESPKLNVLNVLKVTHILVDDPNVALFKRETDETKQFYFARNPLPHLIIKDNVLYVYLRATHAIILTPKFFDKFLYFMSLWKNGRCKI